MGDDRIGRTFIRVSPSVRLLVTANDNGVIPMTAPARLRAPGVGSLTSIARSAGLHGLWIGIWSAVGLLGTALTPALLQRPTLLLALSPRTFVVVLAAAELGLLPFLLLGVARLSVADWSYFELGRRTGFARDRRRLVQLSSRVRLVAPLRWAVRVSDRLASMLCRSAPAAALVLALRPNGRYLAIAGAYGVSARLAAASSLIGTVAYLVVVHRSLSYLVG